MVLTGKRILVTGGAGFIGSALTQHLAVSNDVTVFDNLSSGDRRSIADMPVELVVGDVRSPALTDLISTSQYDIVLHAAANASVPGSVEAPWDDMDTNLLGTLRVLDGARHSLGTRIVLFSSAAVYGSQRVLPIAETAQMHPESPYGASKAAAEAYCSAYGSCYDVDACAIRIFNVYGPTARRFVIHDIVRKLLHNPSRISLLGNGMQVRDFLFIEDAARAIERVAANGVTGEVYNVAGGVGTPIRELAAAVAETLGLPSPAIECTGSSWAGDINAWYANIDRLTSLGHVARHSLRSGLARTVPAIVEQLAGNTQTPTVPPE